MTSPATWLRRLTATTTAGGLLLLGAPVLVEYVGPPDRSPTGASHESPVAAPENSPDLSPDISPDLSLVSARHRTARRIVRYTVARGDTATGLAVRFHAWTDELLAINHLRHGSTLYVGDRIRIPVVRAAARKARHHKAHRARPAKHRRPVRHTAHRSHHKAQGVKQWRHPDPSRATVRRVIIDTANRYGVNPDLALAIAWQEGGWQMHHVSSAQAIGAMQILPSTGRWMSGIVGRHLHLYRLHDNVTAGVVLIKVLRQQARLKHAIAGYYQGLAGVRAFGMYDSTKAYVVNVMYLKKRIAHGWNPA